MLLNIIFIGIVIVLFISIRIELYVMHRDRALHEVRRLNDQSVQNWALEFYVAGEDDNFIQNIFTMKYTFEQYFPGLMHFIDEQEKYNDNF